MRKNAISGARARFVLSAWLIALAACTTASVQAGSVENIAPAQAWERIQSDPSVQVLDVRTAEEVAQGTLPNLTAVADWHQWQRVWPQVREKLDPNKPVLVYCHSGRRSAAAAAALEQAGFRHILNLEGGITAWKRSGLPIE